MKLVKAYAFALEIIGVVLFALAMTNWPYNADFLLPVVIFSIGVVLDFILHVETVRSRTARVSDLPTLSE